MKGFDSYVKFVNSYGEKTLINHGLVESKFYKVVVQGSKNSAPE